VDDGNGHKRYVSNAELEARLEKIPTRWEVRALVLGALIASQLVPPVEMARAYVMGLLP
jgi:hypothetical protein